MRKTINLLVLLSLCNLLAAQKKEPYKAQWQLPPPSAAALITVEQQQEIAATEAEMEWFKDAKLGVFVHWGPALQVTTVLSWGRDGERPGANKPAKGGVAAETYDAQYKTFDPVHFDADRWMEQVKAFGAKYVVFTAKHHDGFCMFDAPNTDYDIMNTPFGRDICRELADAAHRHDVKLFWYYSQPDWTHPDCLREEHYSSYLPYMKAQVEHLFTNYGRIDGVFWDGLASKYWHWDTYELMKQLRAWQPGLLSNPRGGFGWPDNDHRGSFDTPEQSLGPVDHHRYWEACLTMTDKWLYSPQGPVKTAETVLGMLIQVAGNGGNLLLNLGPDGKGEFVAEEAEQAERVGEWLGEYGHTLYGTRRGIYIGGDWGASTQQGSKLYLHILQRVADNAEVKIALPELPVDITTAVGVTPGFKGYQVEKGQLILTFDPAGFSDNLDNIVELTLADNPANYARIVTWEAEPLGLADFTATASTFTKKGNRPEVIYNIRENVFSEGIRLKSWWEPEKYDARPTLTLELKAARTISTVLLSENMRSHSVRDFTLSTKDEEGSWRVVYTGNLIGEGLRVKLSGEPVYGVKLTIDESKYKTQLTAFNIYE